MNLNKSKKGNVVVSVIIIIVVLMAMLYTTLILQEPLEDIKTEFTSDPDSSAEAKLIITKQQTNFQNDWDNLIVFIIMFLWIFGIISAFFIDSHPVFFILAIIFLLITFYVAAIIANDFQTFIADDNIADYANNNYTKSVWIMQHLVEILIVMATSFSIALYAKFRGGGL